jgi:hypothetical protein
MNAGYLFWNTFYYDVRAGRHLAASLGASQPTDGESRLARGLERADPFEPPYLPISLVESESSQSYAKSQQMRCAVRKQGGSPRLHATMTRRGRSDRAIDKRPSGSA